MTVVNGSAKADTNFDIGFVYTALEYETLAYSPGFTNADCAFFSFASNYSSVQAYLTTESDLEAMLNPRVLTPSGLATSFALQL